MPKTFVKQFIFTMNCEIWCLKTYSSAFWYVLEQFYGELYVLRRAATIARGFSSDAWPLCKRKDSGRFYIRRTAFQDGGDLSILEALWGTMSAPLVSRLEAEMVQTDDDWMCSTWAGRGHVYCTLHACMLHGEPRLSTTHTHTAHSSMDIYRHMRLTSGNLTR